MRFAKETGLNREQKRIKRALEREGKIAARRKIIAISVNQEIWNEWKKYAATKNLSVSRLTELVALKVMVRKMDVGID